MACSNCFNGCGDIISDKCVKYTGIDIPGLGISTGDNLLHVENQIISKLLGLLSGQDIFPTVNNDDLCSIVSSFLPSSGAITLNDVIHALFKSVCALDGRLTNVEGAITALNVDYVIGCLSGVSANSGTHAILQATITKLCEVSSSVALLAANLSTNYVLISDINSYIASYITGQPVSTLYNSRMIPYVAVPYFGVTTGIFDITGAGIGDWTKIYLCNGQNLTPDLRGRTLVGATTMGNTAFDPAVDPAISGNPTYSLNSTLGSNLAYLTSPSQIPFHTHVASVVINDPGHFHNIYTNESDSGNGNRQVQGGNEENKAETAGQITQAVTGLKGTGAGQNVFVTIEGTGGGAGTSGGHNNIQPVHSTNYIIYIP